MPKILVVEGNPPELALDRRKAMGGTTAQHYANALHEVAPGLEIDIAQPMFSDHNADAIDFASFDGMAVTGSGVSWSAADDRAAPYRDMCERAFKAGMPVFGSCWGMQTAAMALGGQVQAGPNGVEAGFARSVRPTDHPMHAGRRESFDVICMHRDDANTVSLSHISVDSTIARFNYADGAPCESSFEPPIEIELIDQPAESAVAAIAIV